MIGTSFLTVGFGSHREARKGERHETYGHELKLDASV